MKYNVQWSDVIGEEVYISPWFYGQELKVTQVEKV